jgi:hypothetical protein
VKLTRPDKRKHWFRPLNFEADNVKSMVSSLQSCGTQCLAKEIRLRVAPHPKPPRRSLAATERVLNGRGAAAPREAATPSRTRAAAGLTPACPERGDNARCDDERWRAEKATQRLRDLIANGNAHLTRVACACRAGE